MRRPSLLRYRRTMSYWLVHTLNPTSIQPYYRADGALNWARMLPVWFGCLAERYLGRARASRWHLLTGHR